jgi:hypothetical protein
MPKVEREPMPFLKYKVPATTAIALMLLLGPIDRLTGQPAATQPQDAGNPTIGGEVQDEKQSPMPGATDLQIRKWAAIEGRLLVNGKPAANESVDLESHDPNAPMNQSEPRMMVSQWVQTNASGRFKFEHVLPTNLWIGLPVFTPEPDGKSLSVSGLTESQSVTLLSGQTLIVNLGK